MTSTSNPSSRSTNPAEVITATGAASPTTNATRAAGTAGSIGTYAAPVFNTAKIAATASTERGNNNPTRCPGPAPQPTNKCANRFDASSSSPYVTERPPPHNATASGARTTCSPNTAGIDPTDTADPVNTPRLPHPNNRTHSTPSNTPNDDNNPPQAAAIPTNTRSNRATSVWMSAALNSSVSYSTRKPSSLPGRACTAS